MPHKIWLALFFGYNGSTFHGMQHQREQSVNSIQKLLITTLYNSSLLPCKNYNQLVRNYKFNRAARTDKGVHAVLNGIACLFTIPDKFFDQQNMLKKNELEVEIKMLFQKTEIVVHGIRRVSCRFDIRQMVRSRTYCYICPLNYFMKRKEVQKKQEQKDKQKTQKIQQKQQQNSEQKQTLIIEKINECCKKFIGTHNFHNYSKNLKAKDPKARRYILQFGCQKLSQTNPDLPIFTNTSNQSNSTFLKFTITGQSFVYHQIRKIIGSIVQVFMSQYEPSFIENTFFNNQFYIPLAPPFGLYLYCLSFQSYNRKKDIPEKIQFGHGRKIKASVGYNIESIKEQIQMQKKIQIQNQNQKQQQVQQKQEQIRHKQQPKYQPQRQHQQASIKKLQSYILSHILQINPQSWDQWYNQVSQGVVPKFQEDQQNEEIDDN